jgi:hypothetical protein
MTRARRAMRALWHDVNVHGAGRGMGVRSLYPWRRYGRPIARRAPGRKANRRAADQLGFAAVGRESTYSASAGRAQAAQRG